jgi:hypothetical protein
LFERPHHLRIASVLQSLDGALLLRHGCYFGGGTAIVLLRGEYRESADIDFLVSGLEGYRELRRRLTEPQGLGALVRKGGTLRSLREVRADQYGLRTMVQVGGVELKLEMVFERRIALEPPARTDRICGIPTLTRTDLGATKLLANSDRWGDDSVMSRDLLDLAMLDPPRAVRMAALKKARGAYGEAIDRDFQRALAQLQRRRGRLEECLAALGMEGTPPALVWEKLKGWRALMGAGER